MVDSVKTFTYFDHNAKIDASLRRLRKHAWSKTPFSLGGLNHVKFGRSVERYQGRGWPLETPSSVTLSKSVALGLIV